MHKKRELVHTQTCDTNANDRQTNAQKKLRFLARRGRRLRTNLRLRFILVITRKFGCRRHQDTQNQSRENAQTGNDDVPSMCNGVIRGLMETE